MHGRLSGRSKVPEKQEVPPLHLNPTFNSLLFSATWSLPHAGTWWWMWLPCVGDSACNQVPACNHLLLLFICNFTEGQSCCNSCNHQCWREEVERDRGGDDTTGFLSAFLLWQEKALFGRCLLTNNLQVCSFFSDSQEFFPGIFFFAHSVITVAWKSLSTQGSRIPTNMTLNYQHD